MKSNNRKIGGFEKFLSSLLDKTEQEARLMCICAGVALHVARRDGKLLIDPEDYESGSLYFIVENDRVVMVSLG